MMPEFDTTHEHVDGRGSAHVLFEDDKRVLYHSWDNRGEQTQRNGCRAPADFNRDWARAH